MTDELDETLLATLKTLRMPPEHLHKEQGLVLYVLADNGVVPRRAKNMKEWDEFLCTADRTVACTHIPPNLLVSTVFLAIDHSFGTGPPLLFETMVFLNETRPYDKGGYQNRYTTWAEAEKGHAEVVAELTRDLENAKGT